MKLLIILLAFAFVQIWEKENPLHKDAWFSHLLKCLRSHRTRLPAAVADGLAIVLPVACVVIVGAALTQLSVWLILPFYTLVFLYAIGRGEYLHILKEFTQVCGTDDWQASLEKAQHMGVQSSDIEAGDWALLYQRVLQEAVYRGFERTFAVLFWFMLLSAPGALLYRLLFIYNRDLDQGGEMAKRILWLLEWPVVRVLGLSFAFTGNFVGCLNRWRHRFWCPKSTTEFILAESVMGALSVSEQVSPSCEVTRQELNLLKGLYVRTLWFWLGLISLFVIFA